MTGPAPAGASLVLIREKCLAGSRSACSSRAAPARRPICRWANHQPRWTPAFTQDSIPSRWPAWCWSTGLIQGSSPNCALATDNARNGSPIGLSLAGRRGAVVRPGRVQPGGAETCAFFALGPRYRSLRAQTSTVMSRIPAGIVSRRLPAFEDANQRRVSRTCLSRHRLAGRIYSKGSPEFSN